MSKKTFELDFRGRKIIVENGEVAKQFVGLTSKSEIEGAF